MCANRKVGICDITILMPYKCIIPHMLKIRTKESCLHAAAAFSLLQPFSFAGARRLLSVFQLQKVGSLSWQVVQQSTQNTKNFIF